MCRLRAGWGFLALMYLAVGCGGSPPAPGPMGGKGGGTGGAGGATGGSGGGTGGTGGSTSDGGGGDAPPAASRVRVVSSPVRTVMAGEAMRYRVVASDPSVTFQAMELPEGATLDSAGNLFWTPTPEQSGARRVQIKVQAGDDSVIHDFSVTVGKAQRQRLQAVDPNAPDSTSITVDAPLSSIRGAGVQIEPGSLIAAENVDVTISSIENAPVPPSALLRGVPIKELKPVELGPGGTAFRKAARVQLPVSAEVLKRGTPAVMTIDPVTGAWEKVKTLTLDKEQGIVTAEIEHFSTYVVAPEPELLEAALSRGGAGTACASSLILRAALKGSPADLPASFVNGFAGDAANVAAVLAGLKPGQTLQVFFDATARANDGPSERGWLLLSATRKDGGFGVSVTGSQHAGAFLRLPDTMSDAELFAVLAGRKAHMIFNGLGALDNGVSVTVELSLYLVDGADADRPPLVTANPLTRETFEAAQLANDAPDINASADASLSGFDRDCDQAPDKYDMEPDGDAPPRIFAGPPSPVHLLVGGMATLKVGSDTDDVTFRWTGSDASLQLSGNEGASTTITARQTGVYQVVVTAQRGSGQSRFVWDVLVDAADTMAMNTKPQVKIASSAAVARVGDIVWLQAVGRDREQPVLSFGWQASDPAVLTVTSGPRVPFLAAAPGDYKVTCIANDGLVDSDPATVVITVLAPSSNRAPDAPWVVPLSAIVTHAAGEVAQVALYARGADPDGDPVTFTFLPDPSVSRAVSLTRMGTDTAVVRSPVDGLFIFYVAAQDPQGATSAATTVRVQVMPAGSTAPNATDSDGDGYPDGADCGPHDPKVFPGAPEICGNDVDENCDGRKLTMAECDADGDRFTVEQGDCDDHDPRRNPAAPERCDGLDNNCNGEVDETFKLGEGCYAGTGACRMPGKTRCSDTQGGVVCDAQPGKPTPETCDGVDNDCNGRVDDLPTRTVGTADSCGACGMACPQVTNGVSVCVVGGCAIKCAPGYVDLDRNPGNGCECRMTNNGIEICDGLDNNCNGIVDDGITDRLYTGDQTTSGVGVCGAGYRVCRNGVMVEEKAARLPTPEVCDGLDNDCNGRVDEIYDLMSDARNCGGCGITCALGVSCVNGRCGDGSVPLPPPPPPVGGSGQVQIGICPLATGATSCVDLLSDPANCGGCGKICPQGTFCGLGSCLPLDKLPVGTAPPPVIHPTCPLPPPPTSGVGDAGVGGCPLEMPDVCKSLTGNLYCTSLRYDNASCGACGVACPAGAFCRDGRCTTTDSGSGSGGSTGTAPAPTCREPFKFCSDPFGGSYCTDLTVDPRNCGGCGRACGANTYCKAGICVSGEAPPPSACAPPASACQGPQGQLICTDIYRDPGNCGRCGQICPAGSYCREGNCYAGTAPPPTCYAPMATCKTPEGMIYCSDTFHDPGNCGACGMLCPPNTYCGDGKCLEGAPPPPPCDWPRALCESPRGDKYCTDPNRDPVNCGACGTICPQGTYCEQGKCLDGAPPPPTCGPPLTTCKDPTGNIFCTDLLKDPRNCGGCGMYCPPDTWCGDSKCQPGSPPPPTCDPPMASCRDSAGNLYCTDPAKDPRNCGGCGIVCPADGYCGQGQCQSGPPPVSCQMPMVACRDPNGYPFCTDPMRDPRNCGGCGLVCTGDSYCLDGRCQASGTPACSAPQMLCKDPAGNPICVDPSNNRYNCGQCGITCAPDQVCQSGMCVVGMMTCSPPLQGCKDPMGNPICTDTSRDRYNCGQCGIVCGPDQVCQNGMCAVGTMTCPQPLVACKDPMGNPICADTTRDRYNCGQCGIVCGPDQVCQNGMCAAQTCSQPLVPCRDPAGNPICTDTTRDRYNCGQCGYACAPDQVCQSGMCTAGTMACSPPLVGCKDPMGYPICTDTTRDRYNCGQCGIACAPDQVCQSGMCTVGTMTCSPPLVGCKDPMGNPICTDLQSDPKNCGMCGYPCAPTDACIQGKCQPPPPPMCQPPQYSCPPPPTGGPGYCADFSIDPQNCGGCGRVCQQGYVCQMGRCVLPPPPP